MCESQVRRNQVGAEMLIEPYREYLRTTLAPNALWLDSSMAIVRVNDDRGAAQAQGEADEGEGAGEGGAPLSRLLVVLYGSPDVCAFDVDHLGEKGEEGGSCACCSCCCFQFDCCRPARPVPERDNQVLPTLRFIVLFTVARVCTYV